MKPQTTLAIAAVLAVLATPARAECNDQAKRSARSAGAARNIRLFLFERSGARCSR